MAKVSGILLQRGAQLISVYSWARLAILVAGKGRRVEGIVFISSVSSLSFLFLFLPGPTFSSPLLSPLSLFSLSLGDDTKWLSRVDVSLNPNSTQSVITLWLWSKADILIAKQPFCIQTKMYRLYRKWCISLLSLVMLNKLRCHANFQFSAS